MKDQITTAQVAAENWDAPRLLNWAFDTFENKVAISSAFGAEGMALIDIASRLGRKFRIFTLDTDFLFVETYNLIDRIQERYGIEIERVFSSLTPDEQERIHGDALWTRDPNRCCNLRKVEPLRRKLSELSAWITSIRRDQTAFRQDAAKIQWDTKFGLVKINPIADWTSQQVWRYIQGNNVPYNSLHDQGYPSIGCAHCTRAVRPGEDPRAGRWSGTGKTECGLHVIGVEPLSRAPEADA
jgi:phosphoadenosine phosphosulfate reductase